MKATIELTENEYEQLSTLAGDSGVTPAEYAAHRVKVHLQARGEVGQSGEWLETDSVGEGVALSGLEYTSDAVPLP